ncbi:MAG: anhydro-N-acetylmuramic acid kinase [Acidimicrobiales bacterium]
MRVIGMISGTSFDAVEALLVELEHDGEVLVCDLVEHRSVPYPRATHDSIAALLPPAASTIEQVCRLDVEIGQFFGTVAKDLVERHGPVDVVCSHGQTVYHWVEGDVARGTLQLGEPAWIAELTGAAVVSDVRNRDIACGGHGAPLASLLDVLLLGSQPSATSGSLNLGGIANVTVVGPDQPPIAFDIGPANALMDVFVHALTGGEESFDRDGALAARGKPDTYLVDRLLDDPYFSLPPPKSTGKEYFNFGYVSSRLPEGREITPEDLLASLTVASAEMVAMALRPYDLDDLVVAGGGTRNPTLMGQLQARLPGVPVRRIDELGVPEEAKEALVFAVIGFLTLSGITATIASCTGAARPSVLGSITPGAGPLPVPTVPPAGARVCPTRLRVRTPLRRGAPSQMDGPR